MEKCFSRFTFPQSFVGSALLQQVYFSPFFSIDWNWRCKLRFCSSCVFFLVYSAISSLWKSKVCRMPVHTLLLFSEIIVSHSQRLQREKLFSGHFICSTDCVEMLQFPIQPFAIFIIVINVFQIAHVHWTWEIVLEPLKCSFRGWLYESPWLPVRIRNDLDRLRRQKLDTVCAIYVFSQIRNDAGNQTSNKAQMEERFERIWS